MFDQEQVEEKFDEMASHYATFAGRDLTTLEAAEAVVCLHQTAVVGVILEWDEDQIANRISEVIRFVHRENPKRIARFAGAE